MSPATARRTLLGALALLAACGGGGGEKAELPPPLQFEAPAGVAPVARGERLGKVLGCTGCHGDDLTGRPWIEDPREAILFTSNLTRAPADYSDAELAHAIRFGARPDGSPLWEMPSHIFTHLSDPDMAPLIAWLRSLPPAGEAHPRIRFGPEGRRWIAGGEMKPIPQQVREARSEQSARLDGHHEWARYMIRATCSECHGLDLTGGGAAGSPPDLIVVGGYSREQFRHLLRTGEPVGGRRLALMAAVARGRFVHLTEREVDAIYDYLAARVNPPQ